MSTNINQTGSKNGGLGAKAEGMVDQAKEFGRDMKNQAGALTQSATDAVKTQAGNLTEQAKEVASDAGDKGQSVHFLPVIAVRPFCDFPDPKTANKWRLRVPDFARPSPAAFRLS